MRWHYLLLFLLCIPSVAALDTLDVYLDEAGEVTNYLNTYWVVNVNGSGTINNPTTRDLFDVRLYFDMLTLDIIHLGGDGYFDGNSLVFGTLQAGDTVTFDYQVVGITAEPPTLTGKGVLYTAFAKRNPRIFSDLFGELQKAPLEDASITGAPRRLVSVTLSNPTGFQFTIESMRVIKTPALNPNTVMDEWTIVNSSSPRLIDPDGFFVHDFLDPTSADGEVYWLNTVVYISRVNFIDNNTISRYTEENLTIPIEQLNYTNYTDNSTRSFLASQYVLRKTISDTIAIPGEPVTISLVLHNLGGALERYQITDSLPAGFIADRELKWSGDLPGRNAIVVDYLATLEDTSTAGIDAYPAAEASIRNKRIFSQGVPFIRQFLPDERVYVQKRVKYRDDERVEVTLLVQNLGKIPIEDGTLKDYLADDDLFAEISETPESKGVWKLPVVGAGEEWSVVYVTEMGDSLTRLPMLYGVSSHSVLRSIVLENVVSEAWEFVRTNIIEIVGIIVVLGVPAILLFGRRFGLFRT